MPNLSAWLLSEMARSMPMHRALLAAHNFAEKHVRDCGKPDAAAFDREWDAFCARNPKLTFDDIQVIYAYATAALYYTPRKRWWVRDNGAAGVTFVAIEHEAVPDLARGLWAGRVGNVDALQGVAA